MLCAMFGMTSANPCALSRVKRIEYLIVIDFGNGTIKLLLATA